MWEDTMVTMAMVSVATLMYWLCIPIGILMARSDRASFVTPILDIMQTIPSFVYLIPVVMLGYR